MRAWIIALIALSVAACASTPQSPATGIVIEKVGSYMVRIEEVAVDADDAGVHVNGRVMLNPGYSRLIPGSVRIEALDAAGVIVHAEQAALIRLNAHGRSARFFADIAIDRSRVRHLRIIHQFDG